MIPVRELVALVAPKQLAEVPDVRVGAKASASGSRGQPAQHEGGRAVVPGGGGQVGSLGQPVAGEPGGAADAISRGDPSTWTWTISCRRTPRPRTRRRTKAANAKTDGTDKSAKPGKPSPEEAAGDPAASWKGVAKLTVDRGRAAEVDYSGLKADLAVKRRAADARDAGGGRPGRALLRAPARSSRWSTARAWSWPGARCSAWTSPRRWPRSPTSTTCWPAELSAKIDVTGKGTAPESDQGRRLNGKLSGKLEDGQFLPASLLGRWPRR